MFVHAVDGGWMASPFWRRHIVLSDAADIAKLKEAGIAGIVIDLSKGVGPAPASTIAPPPADAPASVAPPPAESIDAARKRRRRSVSEIERAKETVERSKVAVMRMFAEARLGHAVDAAAASPLVDEIAESVARDAAAMIKVTRLKSKDEYTYLHSIAVAALMIAFARHLGLPEEEVRDLGMAGLLHDIGKMAVPSALLEKQGKLDPPELAVVRHHPEKGHALLRDGRDIAPVVLDVCLHHHERVDGRGYPFGLTGDQLSLAARMSAICDVYDAVTSLRPYKRPWPPSEALARMVSWEGHFDADLLASFIGGIGIQPLDGLVRLRSNRLALVIEGNADDPTTPRVRAFYDAPSQRFVTPIDVGTGDLPGDDPIHCMERGSYWFADTWPGVRQRVKDHGGGSQPPSRDADDAPAAAPSLRQAG